MSKQIETSEDIALLVKMFYAKVYDDELLSPIFQDVAKVKLVDHLPIMINFWESILLGTRNYHNNTYQIHFSLNQKCPLSKQHFKRWILLFHATVDEHFYGSLADKAKVAAERISDSMQIGFVDRLRLTTPQA